MFVIQNPSDDEEDLNNDDEDSSGDEQDLGANEEAVSIDERYAENEVEEDEPRGKSSFGVIRMAANGWEWLRMSGNGCECLGMAANVWEWLGMAGNGWECLGMSE